MKVYYGQRINGICTVEVLTADGRKFPLAPRLDLRNHSPDGFQWGYGGSGPAQLALALLCDALRSDERAASLYQQFKFSMIAGLDCEFWSFTDAQIRLWATRAEEANRGAR